MQSCFATRLEMSGTRALKAINGAIAAALVVQRNSPVPRLVGLSTLSTVPR
jgi:hypothetical protein